MPLEALATLILLVALATILYGPWQTFCTDAARQTLFEVRDDLFDLAAQGKLSFQSPAYRAIRTAIEQNIRYAHTLTLWRFIAIFWHMKRSGTLQQKSDLTRAIESISDVEVRNQIHVLAMRVTRENMWMMVTKSPLLFLILVFAYFCSRLWKLFGGAWGRFSSLLKKAGEAIGSKRRLLALSLL